MKIINQGVDMRVTPVPMCGGCNICKTYFECNSTEAKHMYIKGVGYEYSVECPTCKHSCSLEKSLSRGEIIGGIIAGCFVLFLIFGFVAIFMFVK